jgi:hypothetical protein
LFALDFRHLAERMFFARYAKQQHAKRDSSDAAAEEKSHNALAQLSASGVARKIKPDGFLIYSTSVGIVLVLLIVLVIDRSQVIRFSITITSKGKSKRKRKRPPAQRD